MQKPRLLYGVLGPNSTGLPLLLAPTTPPAPTPGGSPAALAPQFTAPPPAPLPAPLPAPPSPAPAPGPGFPADTAPEDMTDAQEKAYWKHRSRQNEAEAKKQAEWRKANEEKVSGYDQLLAASQTEAEKAIAAATVEATSKANAAAVPKLVAAEFRAAAKGALSTEQVEGLLAPLDKTYFLTDAGEVDTAKVEAYVTRTLDAAPPAPGGRWPGTGGQGTKPAGTGTPPGGAQQPSLAAGRQRYLEKYGPKQTTST